VNNTLLVLLLLFVLLQPRSSTKPPTYPQTYPPGAYPPGVVPPAGYYPPGGYYPGQNTPVGAAAAAIGAAFAAKLGGAGVQPNAAPTSGGYNYATGAYTSGTPGAPPSSGPTNADFFGTGQASTSSFAAYAPGASAPGPYAPNYNTPGSGDALLPAYADASTSSDTSLWTA